MKRLVAGLIGIISICLPISGQELEYKMELGGGVGGCFYLGDANTEALFITAAVLLHVMKTATAFIRKAACVQVC